MLLIYGCGGHARSLAEVAIFNGYSEIEFIDDYAKEGEVIFHYKVLKSPSKADAPIILAIGDNAKRANLFQQLDARQVISLISKSAYVGINTQIDIGTFVGHFAYIGPNVSIGKNSIINTHCVVEHDCIIGANTHISVNTTIAGKCNIGSQVMIGAGATVIDGITIKDNIIVGAGSVVVSNLLEAGTYVGVPAKKIK